MLRWLRRMSTSVVPVVVMAFFMLGSLWLLSAATENSGQFSRMHVVLVVVNVIGLIVLVGLIGVDVVRLVRQHRRAATGSQLTARLVAIFVIMALVPVSIVFYFSIGFIQKGIDSWFDVRIERAMEDALELSRSSLDMLMRDRLKQTRKIAAQLRDIPNAMAMFNLNELRSESGATELTLLQQSGRVIASASADASTIIPQKPGSSILSRVRDENEYVGLAPIDNLGLHIRAAVRIDPPGAAVDSRVLFALYPMDPRASVLADNVQSAIAKYKELVYLRDPLKQSFSFTLSLVLLVTLLSAVWAAFFFAQRLVAPIRILAIGTRAVASGNYHKKLPITRSDELGALVQSFVDMTDKVSEAQREVQYSQHRAEREQNYLRAILGRLSSGVITLDKHQRVRAVNAAASQILELNMDAAMGSSLAQIETDTPELKTFIEAIAKHISGDPDDWREEVVINAAGRHKVLMCQGARLPEVKGISSGFVVVFDDVTAMIQAQRDAAWGEVARRLAHEIKNPLTPIQLSAERLRRKYLDKMAPQDAEVLDRSTHTIVQQVQSMKDMVEAFSEYARAPKLQPMPLLPEALIREVLDLYAGEKQQVTLQVHGNNVTPMVKADAGRMRQLLHNLIRNAIESLAERSDGRVEIHLQEVEHGGQRCVEIRIEDNGPGIPEDMLDTLFEPYATSKPKGSGLGLAVVKRIVEEHDGLLYAENRAEGGARIVILLPALKQDTASLAANQQAQGGT
ncbi:MAG TPA: HAMP domain-containing protein [Gammaproteobacteria bacterium]|nr:HAMP domain-containing protein [Gammaproteobacteria bacterium]